MSFASIDVLMHVTCSYALLCILQQGDQEKGESTVKEEIASNGNRLDTEVATEEAGHGVHKHKKNSLKVDNKDVTLPWIICEVSMHVQYYYIIMNQS